jgi:hypothetical protein
MATRTKISNDGRGTFLIWSRVQHADITWIVGHITDNAGRYTKPKLYHSKITTRGCEYIIIDGRRVHISDPSF